jgi:hypothetical protein
MALKDRTDLIAFARDMVAHYSVYVVLLKPEVLNIPQIRRRNPKRDPLNRAFMWD